MTGLSSRERSRFDQMKLRSNPSVAVIVDIHEEGAWTVDNNDNLVRGS